MAKRVYIRYFTKDKLAKVNEKNYKVYEKYRRTKIARNRDVKESTYKTYQNYFNQFLVFVMENYDNEYILSEEFMEMSVDVLEDFIIFCQDTLGNHKKVINTKLSAVSTFYAWAVKRDLISSHPFDKKLERMVGAKEEKLIGEHFLNDEQIKEITEYLMLNEKGKYDIQDILIWRIALDSGCRLGAISRLNFESLDKESMSFTGIREKLGKITDVPFTSKTLEYIEQWEAKREEMGVDNDNLFVVRYNDEWCGMSKTSIYKRVKKIGEILGIKDFRPHSIRKTAINRIVEKTGNLTLAQDFAGHESPETTASHYVKKKSKAEIRDKMSSLMAEGLD